MEAWRQELYHHGIKGQKWGVRNGPPYPLKPSARSSAEKRQTSGSFARNKQSEAEKMRRKYGVIGDSGTSKSSVTRDAKAIAEKYGFSMVSRPQTVSEDIKSTDPGYWNHQDDDRWLNNCTHGCIAFAARRRGLNVEAAPMSAKQGAQGGETVVETCNRYFKGHFREEDFHITKIHGNQIASVVSQIALLGIDVTRTGGGYEKKASTELGKLYQDVPNGGYGMVKMETLYGGHVFVWYKEDGVIKFADSQAGINARVNFDNIARYGTPALASIRFDDLELDPSRINEAIQSPSSELRHALGLWEGSFKMEAWRTELYHYGIKGQKWGIRRFQSKDGTLTTLGRKRRRKSGILGGRAGSFRDYLNDDGSLNDKGREKKKVYDEVNNFSESRQKYNRAMNQDRQDAIDNFKRKSDNSIAIAREGMKIGNEGTKLYDRFAVRKKTPTVDLSSMTDKELQARINRLNMEQTYQRLMASKETSKGRQFVDDVLAVGGSALAITSSALVIALSIKQLRGGL